jgi:hypothetical protein
MTERLVKQDPTEPRKVAPSPSPPREPRPGTPLPATFKPGQNPTRITRRTK